MCVLFFSLPFILNHSSSTSSFSFPLICHTSVSGSVPCPSITVFSLSLDPFPYVLLLEGVTGKCH